MLAVHGLPLNVQMCATLIVHAIMLFQGIIHSLESAREQHLDEEEGLHECR
jgi:hypothetical protein